MFKKIIVTICCLSGLLVSLAAYSSLPMGLVKMFVPTTSKACGLSLPAYSPGFCSSFKAIAVCRCEEKLPSGMCQNMTDIYNRMVSVLGSQLAACQYQKEDSVQDCMDKWNCFRGLTPDNKQVVKTDSLGRLCSGTGLSCPPI